MKLLEGKLYLEMSEMVECGFNANYLSKAKSSGTQCWEFINDPKDKRKVLIGYDALKPEYIEKVNRRFGNPYDLVAKEPILKMVVQDAKANDFFTQYRYEGSKFLPISTVNKYTRAASWLSMLATVQADRSIIKKVLGLSNVPEFYLHAGELIRIEKENGKSATYNGIFMLEGDFPSTYQRLMKKVEAYQKGGYEYLIAPEFGNKRTAKIGKGAEGFDAEVERKQLAVIRRIAALHTNLNAAQVAEFANKVFEKNNWCTIGESRVYQIMEELKAVLTPGRRGERVYNSEVAMQHKRKAPDFPLYYWTLDGWTAELLYQDKGTYNNRLVIVVVLDAVNKYPVGYAIGDRENSDLIKEANRNAIMHMKELFGEAYRPWQLQSDRYALKKLTPFYQAVAHLHTPAAVGNAKSKIIEPYFKYLNTEYCQKYFPQNWSGHNITARKENQVNSEMLDLIKHSFPDRAGVVRQLEAIISLERKRKIEAYMDAWKIMPTEDKRVMDSTDMIMVFGSPIGGTNRITGQGIIKRIGNINITYDSFDPSFRMHRNMDWQIVADTNNLTEVLAVSPDGKLKFLLHMKVDESMAIKGSTQEQREYGKMIDDYNAERRAEITKIYAEDAELVDSIISNTPLALDDLQEAALKLMLTSKGQQKEAIQDAKRLGVAKAKQEREEAKEQQKYYGDWHSTQEEYMRGRIDFDKYRD